MENVVKTILYCYPSFQSVIDGMERLAYLKAVVSFTDSNRTVEQVDKILFKNNEKKRLLALKRTIDYMLCSLSADELMLIEEKFFNKKRNIDENISTRQYYRKQKMVFDKIVLMFKKRGFDQTWFEENYGDIYFLKARYLTIKKIARKQPTNQHRILKNL